MVHITHNKLHQYLNTTTTTITTYYTIIIIHDNDVSDAL